MLLVGVIFLRERKQIILVKNGRLHVSGYWSSRYNPSISTVFLVRQYLDHLWLRNTCKQKKNKAKNNTITFNKLDSYPGHEYPDTLYLTFTWPMNVPFHGLVVSSRLLPAVSWVLTPDHLPIPYVTRTWEWECQQICRKVMLHYRRSRLMVY